MSHHAFTVDEANERVPDVRAVLAELRSLRERDSRILDKLAVLDALWGEMVEQVDNPDYQEFAKHSRALEETRHSIGTLIQERLLDRGIRFPLGGLEHGLVDFPTTLDGRWVYLCWQTDEAEVAFWHELTGGYAGRRPITDDERARMGRSDDPARYNDSALDF